MSRPGRSPGPRSRRALGLAAGAALLACAPVRPGGLEVAPPVVSDEVRPEQRALYEEALRRYGGYAERLLFVTDRLMDGSATLCEAQRVPRTGLAVLGPDEVASWASSPSLRRVLLGAAERVLGAGRGVVVVAVAPASPAEQIGIRPGDRVLRVNGTPVETVRGYRELLRAAPDRAPVHLAIGREGAGLEALLGWRPGCDIPVDVVVGDEPGLVAHARGFTLTSGLVDFAGSEDALAFVVAVHAAHDLLGHGPEDRLDRQAEADYLGCYLVARSGFDVRAGPPLYERWSQRVPLSIGEGPDGPGSLDRVALLEATIVEIDAKRAAGEPLLPEASR